MNLLQAGCSGSFILDKEVPHETPASKGLGDSYRGNRGVKRMCMAGLVAGSGPEAKGKL